MKFVLAALVASVALVACGNKEEAPAPVDPVVVADPAPPVLVDNPDLAKPIPLLQEVPASEESAAK